MTRVLWWVVPLASGTVSLVLAALVLRRWSASRGALHVLLWGLGLMLYAAGSLAEVHRAVFGFTELGFRVWYLTGAVLVAAYLGQGTAYLLLRRPIAHAGMAALVAGTLYAAFKVFTAQLDPAAAQGTELSGAVIASPGVRAMTPFFNVYGTLLLVGGAAWSAWAFHRQRAHHGRMVGNVLIALGGLAPAIGGVFNRFGLPGLYVGELLGAVLMYLGFLRASAPAPALALRPPTAHRASV